MPVTLLNWRPPDPVDDDAWRDAYASSIVDAALKARDGALDGHRRDMAAYARELASGKHVALVGGPPFGEYLFIVHASQSVGV